MNYTANPKRLAIRIRDGAQVIYKLGLKLLGFAAIGPFAFWHRLNHWAGDLGRQDA